MNDERDEFNQETTPAAAAAAPEGVVVSPPPASPMFTNDIQPPEQGLNQEPPAVIEPPADFHDSTQDTPPPDVDPEALAAAEVRVKYFGNVGEVLKGSCEGKRFEVKRGEPVTVTRAQYESLAGYPHEVLDVE